MANRNIEKQFADKAASVLRDGKPALDLETLHAIHNYFEFESTDELDFDAWLHAQIRKTVKINKGRK